MFVRSTLCSLKTEPQPTQPWHHTHIRSTPFLEAKCPPAPVLLPPKSPPSSILPHPTASSASSHGFPRVPVSQTGRVSIFSQISASRFLPRPSIPVPASVVTVHLTARSNSILGCCHIRSSHAVPSLRLRVSSHMMLACSLGSYSRSVEGDISTASVTSSPIHITL